MAIDTEVKRRSVHGYAGASATIAPVPDGAALDEGDRRQVAGIYRGIVSGAGSTLTGTAGAYISPTTTLYSGFLFGGPIGMVNVTSHESGGGESSTSFYHETPAGDNRLLTVIATYKDTAGVASLIFGSAGSGDGEFSGANGIAIASDGSIYVADSVNHRIQVFDSGGTFIRKWGSNGSGDGQFDIPIDIAIDSDGNVYVADRDNSRIQVFDSGGTFIRKWGSNGSGDGQFSYPLGIAISADDEVYVTDSDNHRIQVFDTAGTFLRKWGSAGEGDGEFSDPWGIAISADNTVYIGDSTNSRIQVFDSAGTFLRKWGSSGSGNGQFGTTPGIVLSSTGSVYVIDPDNHRMQVFTNEGAFKRKWGVYGSGNGQFKAPYGIAISGSGYVYVVDSGNSRVQVFVAGLALNAAAYNETAMDVGPMVDSGNYYQAFYTMENPPVGSYQVSLAAPTGPDVFLITAISWNGMETANTDYTGAEAGRAEQEASSTDLQVSHNRAYPDYTLSIWALLYEDATTLTAVADNFHWLTRTVGTLYNAIGFRYIPTATTSNLTFGATASPAVTPRISAVLHLEAVRPLLVGTEAATINSTVLYAGTIAHAGQTLYGTEAAYIAPTTTLYAGSLVAVMVGEVGATIASTLTLYAGTLAQGDGPDLFITGFFIGLGMPAAVNGVYIPPTTTLYAGEITVEQFLEGTDSATIASTVTLYAGAVTEIYTATAYITAGQIYHS